MGLWTRTSPSVTPQGVAPRDDILWDIEKRLRQEQEQEVGVGGRRLLKPAEFASVVTAMSPNKYFTRSLVLGHDSR